MSPASQKANQVAHSQRIHLSVRVVPGAARTQAVGMLGEVIKIRVAAPPEDGAANQALCAWLKKTLGAAQVQVQSGASSRSKLLAVDFAGQAPSVQQLCGSLLAL